MIVNMAALGEGTILSGAASGRRALAALISETSTQVRLPEPLFLNFGWVQVATSSFLRESVLAFRDLVRSQHSNFYPVVANANEVVKDELRELVRQNDVLLTCDLDEDGAVVNHGTIGDLDAKQQITFDLVQELGVTNASELMERYGTAEGIRHTTAWNNRLSSLADLGLIVERREGRSRRYERMFGGDKDGH